MVKILNFSQCLSKLMRQQSITFNQLHAIIGGTRAEIKRLLSSEVSESIRIAAYEKLKANRLFSTEAMEALSHSLVVSSIGMERYRFQYAIEHILTGRPMSHGQNMQVDGAGALSKRLSVLKDAEKIEILCLNSCFPALMETLHTLFQDPDKDIHMWHLIQSDAYKDAAAIVVAATFPLLFDSRYEPYEIAVEPWANILPVGGNQLSLRITTNGKLLEFFFVAVDEKTVYEMPNAAESGMFAYLSKILKTIQPAPTPLKEPANSRENFATLCLTFLSHELNRATYSITNDLCFHQIPADIAVAALRDKSLFSEEDLTLLIQHIFPIHEQRYHNLYRKRKSAYMIITLQGCKRFLETGCSTDHFVGFRPFTLEERKQIFSQMLNNAKSNPYFTPLLLKEDGVHYRYNMECYDKLGVSFDVKDTDYDISKGYRSIFLMYPEFTRQYMKYYLETLVTEKCYSRKESLQLLSEIFDRFCKRYHLTD